MGEISSVEKTDSPRDSKMTPKKKEALTFYTQRLRHAAAKDLWGSERRSRFLSGDTTGHVGKEIVVDRAGTKKNEV